MAGEVQRRLYFALWPDDTLRAAIVAVTAEAVAAVGGRAVPPADFHVTLAFLGSVPAARLAAATVAARGVRAEQGTQPFDRVRTWPGGESTRESRCGPLVLESSRVAPALDALRASLRNALLAVDFALDRREFRPHITLARAPEHSRAATPAAIDWRYAGFVLVESRLTPAGSRYTVVETFGLG